MSIETLAGGSPSPTGWSHGSARADPRDLTPAPAPDGPRPAGRRAWAIAVVAGAAIVTAGAFTTVPGLLVTPLHQEYAWDRGQIALAASVNMVLFGATAPFAAALMERAGIRRVAAGAMLLIAAGALLTNAMASPWQLVLYWGVLIGLGSGCLTMTFAALVTSRWFTRRRGLVTGALSASSHLGPAPLPAAAGVGGRPLRLAAPGGHPGPHRADRGRSRRPVPARPPGRRRSPAVRQRGVRRQARTRRGRRAPRTVTVLVQAMRWHLWLLAGMFVICGASTNGIMWSNWVPAANDHGMYATVAASMLS